MSNVVLYRTRYLLALLIERNWQGDEPSRLIPNQ